MRNCVITPTYSGHFCFIEKYIKSAEHFIVDADSFDIEFIVDENDITELQHLIESINPQKLSIKIVSFDSLLRKQGELRTPSELLEIYGKFSFQTLKKLCAMRESEGDRFLVLDSESVWVRKTNMRDLFDSYFSDPFISFSSISKRIVTHPAVSQIVKNLDCIFNTTSDLWFIENFMWFYDKRILKGLFETYGDPFYIVEKSKKNNIHDSYGVGVFEIILYHRYIFENNQMHNYKLIDVDKMLERNFHKEVLNTYFSEFYYSCGGGNGLVEMFMRFLTFNNVFTFSKIFRLYNYKIIRCDLGYRRYPLQLLLLHTLKPYILAASQDHWFGIGHKKNKILIRYVKEMLRPLYVKYIK